MKRHFSILKKQLLSMVITLTLIVVQASANGGKLGASKIGTGLKSLFSDLFAYLTVLCPIAGGLFAVYFVARRAAADEQDGKMWEKRIKIAIVCGVGGALVSGVITLISSYF